jgi:hypothetical protein
VSLGLNQNFYDLSYDKINNLLYASSTDYFTYGLVNIYDQNNSLIHTFQCGISPGTIVFDIRNNITSIYESMLLDSDKNEIIYDLSGRRMNQEAYLPSGLYIKNKKKFYISK